MPHLSSYLHPLFQWYANVAFTIFAIHLFLSQFTFFRHICQEQIQLGNPFFRPMKWTEQIRANQGLNLRSKIIPFFSILCGAVEGLGMYSFNRFIRARSSPLTGVVRKKQHKTLESKIWFSYYICVLLYLFSAVQEKLYGDHQSTYHRGNLKSCSQDQHVLKQLYRSLSRFITGMQFRQV